MKSASFLVLVWIFFSLNAYAQHTDEIEIFSVQKNWTLFSKLGSSAKKINNRIEKNKNRYLKKLKKEEGKLFAELNKSKTDGFPLDLISTDSAFSFVSRESKRDLDFIAPMQKYYSPVVDSLKTYLKFTKQLKQYEKLDARLDFNLSEEYNSLQRKITENLNVERLVGERINRIKQLLPLDKEFTQFNSYVKEFNYYKAQIKEYQNILEQPNKIEKKLLNIIRELPQFKAFMAKNSELASIFPFPSEGDSRLALLQGRDDVMKEFRNSMGSAAGGTSALQGLQQGQQKLIGLTQKLKNGDYGNGEVLVEGAINPQKSKTFWQRIVLNTNIQTVKANWFFPVSTDLGIDIGYKLNPNRIVGVGGSYKIGWGESLNKIKVSHQGAGIRSFLDWRIKGSMWLTGGFEMNYRSIINDVEVLRAFSSWQKSAVLGISRTIKLNKLTCNTKFLYDFLWRNQVPRTQPLLFRIGYSLK